MCLLCRGVQQEMGIHMAEPGRSVSENFLEPLALFPGLQQVAEFLGLILLPESWKRLREALTWEVTEVPTFTLGILCGWALP